MADVSLPQHVALVLDGNRRWARKQGLGILLGHRQVLETTLETLADHAIARGIPFLTVWAFSTENWRRSSDEVEGLLSLFREALQKKVAVLEKKGIKVQVLGDLSRFPQDIQDGVRETLQKTKHNTRLTLTVALNYGGRDELRRAVQKVAAQVLQKNISPQEITEEMISSALDTGELSLPDPDLIIRTGGEKRLSGFLPWQTVYTELYFTDTLMPDFTPAEFDIALEEYQKRQRRFGA